MDINKGLDSIEEKIAELEVSNNIINNNKNLKIALREKKN